MKKSYLILIICLFTPFFSSCSKASVESTKPRVLVSIPPYIYFVQKIAGDLVEVATLAPEGTNPHIFEPTPKQIQEIYKAKIWIRLGESFEYKVAKTLHSQSKDLLIVDLSKTVPLLTSHDHCNCGHHHEQHAETQDLHIWMSPVLAKKQAEVIAQALSEAFPEHKNLFSERLVIFQEELDQLHLAIKQKLLPFATQAVIVSHPAFAYFCNDYQLEQISIEVEGKDPRPQDIASVMQSAEKNLVRLVLIQEQYNNKGAIALADRLHIPTFSTDPYSSKYEQMLLDITNQIAHGKE